jgi:hypothetical protein
LTESASWSKTFVQALHRAHEFDLIVKVTIGIWIVISTLTALVARAYGQLDFGITLLIAISLCLLGTQVPNILSWTRNRFSIGGLLSFRPWLVTTLAGILVVIVYTSEWLPHFVSSHEEESHSESNSLVGVAGREAVALREKVRHATDELAVATAALRGERGAREKLEADLMMVRSQLESARRQQTLGPITALDVVNAISDQARKHPALHQDPASMPEDPAASMWALVITYPQENTDFAKFLFQLLNHALSVQQIKLPDRGNLDAPALTDPNESRPGITLHGENALNERLYQKLSPCMEIKKTKQTADGLADWYKQYADYYKIVWIEIGKGSPWKEPFRCSE